ncbi:hypothetical protein Droror1_Dr00010326, partial [Drosera rotundifolia]
GIQIRDVGLSSEGVGSEAWLLEFEGDSSFGFSFHTDKVLPFRRPPSQFLSPSISPLNPPPIRPTSISIPFPFHFSPKFRSGNFRRWCSINQTKEDNDAAGTYQSPRGALVVLEIRVPEVVIDEVTKVGEC